MDAPSDQSGPGKASNESRRWIFLVLVFVGAGIGFYFLPAARWIESLRQYVDALGWAGPVAFIFFYALLTVLLVPGTALTIAAGIFFGLFRGTLYAIAASNLGALAAFLLARTVMRARVEAWARARPKFGAIDAALAQSGFKVVLLLRLSPVFPFTFLNYLLGLSRVSIAQFALGSVIGMLPGTALFVYIGSLSVSLAGPASDAPEVRRLKLALQIVGFLATIVVTWLITRMARKALDQKREASGHEQRDVGD